MKALNEFMLAEVWLPLLGKSMASKRIQLALKLLLAEAAYRFGPLLCARRELFGYLRNCADLSFGLHPLRETMGGMGFA